jgi:hypothetical protein
MAALTGPADGKGLDSQMFLCHLAGHFTSPAGQGPRRRCRSEAVEVINYLVGTAMVSTCSGGTAQVGVLGWNAARLSMNLARCGARSSMPREFFLGILHCRPSPSRAVAGSPAAAMAACSQKCCQQSLPTERHLGWPALGDRETSAPAGLLLCSSGESAAENRLRTFSDRVHWWLICFGRGCRCYPTGGLLRMVRWGSGGFLRSCRRVASAPRGSPCARRGRLARAGLASPLVVSPGTSCRVVIRGFHGRRISSCERDFGDGSIHWGGSLSRGGRERRSTPASRGPRYSRRWSRGSSCR